MTMFGAKPPASFRAYGYDPKSRPPGWTPPIAPDASEYVGGPAAAQPSQSVLTAALEALKLNPGGLGPSTPLGGMPTTAVSAVPQPLPPAAPKSVRPTRMPRGMFAGTAIDNAAPAAQSGPVSILGDTNDIPKVETDWANLTKPSLNAADTKVRHPGFFHHNGLGEKILHGVGEFALQYSASQGNPAAMATLQNRMLQQRQQSEWQRQDAQRVQDRGWQVEDRDLRLKQPQYFMSGRDRVAFDPSTGQSDVVYDGPEDYQNYADAVGKEPGDEGYEQAVQDYVLRGNGPTSQSARRALEGVRQQNRLTLKATPTYANLNPRPAGGGRRSAGGSNATAVPRTMAAVIAPIVAKVAAGKPLTPAEQQAYAMYRPGRGGGGRGGAAPTGGLPVVRTPAEAARLPKGTRFQTPDGRVKVVP